MSQATELELLPKQIRFLQESARHVLYSGAVGAGKTYATCVKVAFRAQHPRAREGLCRKHAVTMKRTTLKTLLDGDGDVPAVLPVGTYDHNKSDQLIRIRGGGEIQYFGCDEPEKIGSFNFTGCGVDEAVELGEDDYRQIDNRCRVKIDGLPLQVYGACNPGPPGHFLAKRFGLAMGYQPMPNSVAVQTSSEDNFFLDPGYVESLRGMTGLARARYYEGKWVGSEGLVYDRWDRQVFVVERQGPWNRIIIGQDEGYTNPACLLAIGEDNDGRLHVIEEWYASRKLESDVVAVAQDFNRRYRPDNFQVDPAAAKLRAAMREAGLGAEPADNDVFGGIQRIQQRLVVAGDGRPRLTVSPSCTNLIREFETYEWKDGKDEPVKSDDHALDSARYACSYFDNPGRQRWAADDLKKLFTAAA